MKNSKASSALKGAIVVLAVAIIVLGGLLLYRNIVPAIGTSTYGGTEQDGGITGKTAEDRVFSTSDGEKIEENDAA